MVRIGIKCKTPLLVRYLYRTLVKLFFILACILTGKEKDDYMKNTSNVFHI